MRAWDLARGLLADPALGLVILHELTYPLRYGYLDMVATTKNVLANVSEVGVLAYYSRHLLARPTDIVRCFAVKPRNRRF